VSDWRQVGIWEDKESLRSIRSYHTMYNSRLKRYSLLLEASCAHLSFRVSLLICETLPLDFVDEIYSAAHDVSNENGNVRNSLSCKCHNHVTSDLT
jgi:hypothetical protein